MVVFEKLTTMLQDLFDIQMILVTVVVFICIYWMIQRLQNTKHTNLPPGPRGLLLIQNLIGLANPTTFQTLRSLAGKYGDVFSLYLGQQLIVVLNSYETIHEALVKNSDSFSERPQLPVKLGTLNTGVVLANGKPWKFKRKMFISALRTFGMGKSVMQERILDEVQHLLIEFEDHHGGPFDPIAHVTNSVYNVICSITIGERFDYTDERFVKCMNCLDTLFNLAPTYFGIGFLFPGSGRLLDIFLGPKQTRNNTLIYELIEPFIKEHDQTYDPNNLRDLIDAFLKMEKEWNQQYPNESMGDRGLNFKYYQIYGLILDTFGAGTETTTTTLLWGLLFLVKNPNVQSKIQDELDTIVGRNRSPKVCDKPNLPYTEATITEILRMASTVPLSIPRWTACDTTVSGYDIPKDTFVWPNIYSVLHDPIRWSNPDQFNPDRFLDSHGKFVRPDVFIPFGSGSRVCLGEQLAKMKLFLILSSIVQKYNLVIDEKYPLPPIEARMHLTLQPPRYKLRAIKR
ncbi:cytochrome P450 2U1-like [Saccoglossus kowalevskii]|uniref:Cytochrome P450 2U1-like n=1 Tax=Saccoglossus kowalevskii TaxID=10224 RepID=A0ABM0GRI8_SACKO|nr:PREDICTED: cytochrome P450 2U1-like [Saccoglossus kowalevskii]